jgi:hypothetical protein
VIAAPGRRGYAGVNGVRHLDAGVGMDTTRNSLVGVWIALGLGLGLALLVLLGAALAGLLPWPVPLAAWLLANALVPLTMLRRSSPAVAPGLAGD